MPIQKDSTVTTAPTPWLKDRTRSRSRGTDIFPQVTSKERKNQVLWDCNCTGAPSNCSNRTACIHCLSPQRSEHQAHRSHSRQLQHRVRKSHNHQHDIELREEIKVKNRNWGRLKYDETIMVLSHENLQVGQGTISRGSIKMRHSKIVTVFLEAKIDGGLNSSSSSSEISSGVLNLKSYVMLSGKVNVVGVVRKRRGAEMNCSLTVSLTRQAIQEFHCK